MEDGRIVQRGDHEALLAEGGLYRHLYELQFRPVDESIGSPSTSG
jgi:ABC-type multidrug transport system fused ATPase/permease subunit